MKLYKFLSALILSAGIALNSSAQSPAGASRPQFESRAELEARASSAQASGRSGEAALVRSRLARGDFQSGDRIALIIEGPVPYSDTVIVGTSGEIRLPQMGDVPLAGVLRSELLNRLQAHVSSFLRDSRVRAKPLVRLAILGSVGKPGFYYVPAEAPLADILMDAGGPVGDADLGKVEVRRGSNVILNRDATSFAIRQGMSVDRLNMMAGDEVQVGQKRKFSPNTVLSVSSAILGLIVAITAVRR